jgi:hypothetical protein
MPSGMVVYEVRTDVIVPALRVAELTIHQVLSGNPPYWDIKNPGGVMNAITEGERPKKPDAAESLGFTNELWRTVRRCWLVDVSARPDVKTILSHLNHATWSWERRRLA